MKYLFSGAAASLAMLAAMPAVAQDQDAVETAADAAEQQGFAPDTVYDDNWISIGFGVALGPSYDGSDDYVLSPAPLVQGKVAGVGISPRPAGLALDFIPDRSDGPNIAFGPSVRLRNDRADQIKDEVVKLAGKLDRAVELGVATGISFPKVLNPYDSLSLNLDARWDVAGAHDGMVIEPGVTYFTPLSRGTAASLSIGAEFVDDNYADYYYSVSPQQNLDSGLPEFSAKGGLNSVGTNLLLAFDLDGDLQNGGLAIVAVGGYSRLVGDAKDTPYTSIRGSADQFFGALGIGYTF
ncbi:MipA/OmpV family protein [Altererythrobacter epoxidivorans]|uniref:MipA/OmpV family protein n=1 Tax=Altererythrobacter epoxidivorans TaxID=361183 RepID=UPI001E2EF27F|nr:MipA/OmpV family protein [Altererythrobacter epoxidivorans]